jgi:type I restriction enzyme M protein
VGVARVRDRRGQTLCLDVRRLGVLIDRVQRVLSDTETQRLADTYHTWRGDKETGTYRDMPGSCTSATTAEIAEHG